MNLTYYHLGFKVDDPPHSERFSYDDEPKCEDIVEFRLVYDGRLPSAGTNKRTDEKHLIRKVFHKQIGELLKEHPGLRRFKAVGGVLPVYDRHGFNFSPLISEEVGGAFAMLDVTFLRRDHPGNFVKHGDFDNRIKVLFDALRVPKEIGDLTDDMAPDDGEDPFYCLLDDDRLITSANITTDRLLTPFAGAHEHPLNDTLLVIRVKTGIFSFRNHSETFL